jgi:putative ABC transport system ATP-binding protein
MPATAAPEPLQPQALSFRDVTVERQDADGRKLEILALPLLDIPPGSRLAVTGPSGAGKTTLLDLACGLIRPSRGDVRWGAENLAAWPEARRDRWRRDHVGFIFQEFHLIPELSVLENILLPARFGGRGLDEALRQRALELGKRIGLPDLRRRAAALSRGEQQRTAIARALLFEPSLILADEPTASLDQQSAEAVIGLILECAGLLRASLLVATHDAALIAKLDGRIALRSGHLA